MFTRIKKWLRLRAQNKAYKKIKSDLLSNPVLMVKTKANFEKAFGVCSVSRSPKQWQRLVNVYGVETVSKTEGLTAIQIERRCQESFASRVRNAFVN
jgi:hypothetical protein